MLTGVGRPVLGLLLGAEDAVCGAQVLEELLSSSARATKTWRGGGAGTPDPSWNKAGRAGRRRRREGGEGEAEGGHRRRRRRAAGVGCPDGVTGAVERGGFEGCARREMGVVREERERGSGAGGCGEEVVARGGSGGAAALCGIEGDEGGAWDPLPGAMRGGGAQGNEGRSMERGSGSLAARVRAGARLGLG